MVGWLQYRVPTKQIAAQNVVKFLQSCILKQYFKHFITKAVDFVDI